jgi:hypothetical protein
MIEAKVIVAMLFSRFEFRKPTDDYTESVRYGLTVSLFPSIAVHLLIINLVFLQRKKNSPSRVTALP